MPGSGLVLMISTLKVWCSVGPQIMLMAPSLDFDNGRVCLASSIEAFISLQQCVWVSSLPHGWGWELGKKSLPQGPDRYSEPEG